MPKVSIIIPVYKAEPYIERCARTLFEQTLDDLEYIFIDDCSPDHSIDVMKRVLEEFPNRKHQVKVIHHTKNYGVGATRQDGIDAATGEYIIHCDPDDWVELNIYELMYQEAKSKSADMVICDFFENAKQNRSVHQQIIPTSKTRLFSDIASGSFHTAFWNKLVKTTLAHEFRIPNGINLWEDMSYIPLIMLKDTNIIHVTEPLYHYRIDNDISMIHNLNHEKIQSQIQAVKVLTKYIDSKPNLNKIISNKDRLLLEWRAKSGYLCQPNKGNRKVWSSTFPEVSTKYLRLNLPWKSKLLTFLMKYNLLWLIRLKNIIFDR